MQHLSDIYQGLSDYSQIIDGSIIFNAWKNVVGKELLKHTEPQSFRGGVLTIIVSSGAFAQQLQILKIKILKKINDKLSKEAVKDLKFTSGNLSKESEKKEQDQNVYAQVKLEGFHKEVINETDEKWKGIVENLIMKSILSQSVRKSKGFVKCSVCGVIGFSKEKLCLFCRRESFANHKSEVLKYIQRAPWTSLKDVKEELKIDPEEYFYHKRRLLGVWIDSLNQIFWEIKKQGKTKKLVNSTKILAYNYVMLKTGLAPQNLKDEIIEKNIPKRIWKLIA